MQKTEDRGQKTEDRGQRTEGRGQRTEDRRQRTDNLTSNFRLLTSDFRHLIYVSCFAEILLFAFYGFAAQSINATASQSAPVSVGGGSAALRSSSLRSTSAVLIEQICSKITEGDLPVREGLLDEAINPGVQQLPGLPVLFPNMKRQRKNAGQRERLLTKNSYPN